MKTIRLNNGVEMPLVGFGVFQITDPVQCERAVYDALMAGYRLIDTAASYHNEKSVGRAIRRSGIAREELFITTKLWVADAGYQPTKEAFNRSVENLGLDYLDLYLIHQPFGDIFASWRAMEELYAEQRIRAIGISNFKPDRVMDFICHNQILPAVNQIEVNPWCQQNEAIEFLAQNGIQTQSWASFAEGRNDLFDNEVLRSIAHEHKRSVAQIVLRWLIERDVAVIPKSVNKDRIIENRQVFDFELSAQDMKLIGTLDTDQSAFFDHRDPQMVKWICNLTR